MTTNVAGLTAKQRKVARLLDAASSTLIAYSAPEVPPLGNLTPEGLTEEAGTMNDLRKTIEKVEAILKERVTPMVLAAAGKTVTSDRYTVKIANTTTTRLDQEYTKRFVEAARSHILAFGQFIAITQGQSPELLGNDECRQLGANALAEFFVTASGTRMTFSAAEL